jgi:hypothetical protein
VLAILDPTGATPSASADGPQCAAECVDQAQALRPDPHAGKHLTITCSPARIGAHCMKQWVP